MADIKTHTGTVTESLGSNNQNKLPGNADSIENPFFLGGKGNIYKLADQNIKEMDSCDRSLG